MMARAHCTVGPRAGTSATMSASDASTSVSRPVSQAEGTHLRGIEQRCVRVLGAMSGVQRLCGQRLDVGHGRGAVRERRPSHQHEPLVVGLSRGLDQAAGHLELCSSRGKIAHVEQGPEAKQLALEQRRPIAEPLRERNRLIGEHQAIVALLRMPERPVRRVDHRGDHCGIIAAAGPSAWPRGRATCDRRR